MKKTSFFVLVVLCATASISFAQSANYRAQGKYYSAKECYQGKNYSGAIQYLEECIGLLSGKSNEFIEYLRILSYYNLGYYSNAHTAMTRFFDIIEGREKPVPFTQWVERLTDTEIKDVTKLMDKIVEAVEREKAEAPRKRLLEEMSSLNSKLKSEFSSDCIVEVDSEGFVYQESRPGIDGKDNPIDSSETVDGGIRFEKVKWSNIAQVKFYSPKSHSFYADASSLDSSYELRLSLNLRSEIGYYRTVYEAVETRHSGQWAKFHWEKSPEKREKTNLFSLRVNDAQRAYSILQAVLAASEKLRGH